MAQRVEPKTVTVPAGTQIASPVTLPVAFNPGVVLRLEVEVPPGPSGFMGFMIGHSGGILIPYDGASWIVTDGRVLDMDLHDYPSGNAWFVRAYNLGIYAHNIYLTFHIDETTLHSGQPVQPIPIGPILEQAQVGG